MAYIACSVTPLAPHFEHHRKVEGLKVPTSVSSFSDKQEDIRPPAPFEPKQCPVAKDLLNVQQAQAGGPGAAPIPTVFLG